MTLADTPTATTPSSQRERILDGALRCIGRWGLAKTTLDDLAREAGCSRATVYRLFPGGKDSVIDAVIATEVGRFFAGLAGRLDGLDDLDELVVAGVSHAARTLSEHRALQYLLAHEPELLLPRISFHHLDQILAAVSDFLVPYLAPHVGA